MNKRFHIGLALVLMLAAARAFADPPAYPVNQQIYYPPWWYDYDLVDQNPTAVINNYAPVNIGQLKNVAYAAKLYLDAQLASVGGADIAGVTVGNQTIANFTVYDSTNPGANYQVVQLGQLKAVAQHFYDRLNAVGYNTTLNLVNHGYPSNWAYAYPWNPSTPTTSNYAPANIGQLKAVFSFDLSNFTPSANDPNGISWAWQLALYGNVDTINSSNWMTLSTSGNSSIPDYKNANPSSPANLTVTIVQPLSGNTY